MKSENYILNFSDISLKDIGKVGGKNASLGELFNSLKPLGVNVLDGFSTTAEAYRYFITENKLDKYLGSLFATLDPEDTVELQKCGFKARMAILEKPIPEDLKHSIYVSYRILCERLGKVPALAVRSSATAEDLPEASFAGAAESFLNVRGKEELVSAIHRCFASLFTDRAISYRSQLGYDQMKVALSVGIQPMVRSDIASAGVIFTLDTESGFRDLVEITGSWGLGESIVQGLVTPDEWTVFKPTLKTGHPSILSRKLGSKLMKVVFTDGTKSTKSENVSECQRRKFSLSDSEVIQLAEWSCIIEDHYSTLHGRPQPMDIEWAKDGESNEIFIVQARPETVHSSRKGKRFAEAYSLLDSTHEPLVKGQAVGDKIATGNISKAYSVADFSNVKTGDILVAPHTDPDWEPIMRRVSGIITDQGGRTAHAAIVSRELGLPCIVGCGNATEILNIGDEVTLSCAEGAEGHVYAGKLAFDIQEIEIAKIPKTNTKIMFNVADSERVFSLAQLPNDGVGLARIEFIINRIGVHPMAIANLYSLENNDEKYAIMKKLAEAGEDNPKEYFISRLAEGVAKIAAAFYPKPVILRTSDFKTNEYAKLLGGAVFEPKEENPMLGWRGASRYYDPKYREGFALECAAIRRVRVDMGLINLKVMIPFCRTLNEARKVITELAKNGLVQGDNGLEIYAMCELPSNVVLAKEFLEIFDGYSIGSNDLTQLILGIDRDSGTIADLFDEGDPAVKSMISSAIRAARKAGKPIGICGQAPSDKPDFAMWLVNEGIASISLNPDSAVKTAFVIADAESNQRSDAAVQK